MSLQPSMISPDPAWQQAWAGLAARLEELDSLFQQVQTLELAQPSKESVDQHLRLEFTHGSTAIEGNTLTLRETQLLIEEGITPSTSKQLRELHEVSNHHAAVLQLEKWIGQGGQAEPVSLEKLLHLHQLVMRNIDDERSGQIRSGRVMVTGAPRQPIRPERIEEELTQLIEFIHASTQLSPIIRAAEAHYRFVKIHPFWDGNGRVGRLLMNWIFLQTGYPLVVIPSQERANYIQSLDQADLDKPEAFCTLLLQSAQNSLKAYQALQS